MHLNQFIYIQTRITWLVKSVAALAVSMTLVCHMGWAQSSNSRVFGSLTSVNSEPLTFAAIGLYRADSSLVKGAVSDAKGSFVFSNLSSGAYRIEIKSVEIANHTQSFVLSENENLDLGTITPTQSSFSLDEVVVSSERQLIEVHPDRMVYNVESNVSAHGVNGLELLGQAPGVIIDPNNNIMLQGKSGVRIYINGRPSRLSGEDLTTFLEGMQSDNIESIQLITNPSVRYEAEGNAGIIDIRLKNNITLGYNGTLVSNFSQGRDPRLTNGMTLNYGKGKIGLTANVTRFDYKFGVLLDDVKEQNGNEITLDSDDLRQRFGYNFNTSLTYTINPKHSINASVGGMAPDGDNIYSSEALIDNIDDLSQDQRLISEANKKYAARTMNYGLNYIWAIDEKTALSTDISYGTYGLDQSVYQPNTYLTMTGTELRQSNNVFYHDTEIDIYSVKADLDKKFGDLSISGGFKYYEVRIKNDFEFNLFENGRQDLLDTQRSQFSYTEKVGAVYFMTDYQLSENLKASLGTRLEQTYSRGTLRVLQRTDNEDVTRDYLNVFPNLSLSYKLNNSEFLASYGRRITRPTYKNLNPFENKLNDLTVRKGNPFLNPTYISNYQLSYTLNKTLVISNTYSVIDGYFANLSEVVDETSTRIIPRNMNRSTTNGLSVSYVYEFADFWESNLFMVYNYSTYQSQQGEDIIDIAANIYNIRIQNKISLPKDITMSFNYFYSSPYIWRGFMEVEGYHTVDLAVRRGFFDDKLQLRLSALDFLGTRKNIYYSGDYAGVIADGVLKIDSQRFGFGLTYKFGNNDIKKQSRKGGLSSELDRI